MGKLIINALIGLDNKNEKRAIEVNGSTFKKLLCCAFLLTLSNIALAGDINPYYGTNLVPPTFNHVYDSVSNSVMLEITSSITRLDVFTIYQEESYNTSILGTAIFMAGSSATFTITPSTNPPVDITIQVRSSVTPGLEFVEWTYTFPASMFTRIDPANPLNPYDHYGVVHNEGLDYIINNKTYSGNNLDTFALEIVDNLADFMLLNDPDGKHSTKQEYINDIYTFVDSANTVSFSSLHLSFVEQFYNIFENREINNNQQLANFIDDIKSFETNLLDFINLNPDSLSDIEQKSLLISSSVARYSAVYWSNVSMQGGGLWDVRDQFDFGDDGGDDDPPALGFWKWLKGAIEDSLDWVSDHAAQLTQLVTCDAIGAGSGMLFGNPLGGALAGSVVAGIFIEW